jgi:DNA-binding GntR family transcriptional regulator
VTGSHARAALASLPAVQGDDSTDRRTMTSAASAQLRELIVFGNLRPGEPLRLEDLSARFGMSVSPIREALRQLEMIGFVTQAAYRSASVTRLSLGEMEAVFESRVALETVVVRRAAERFDAATESKLTQILGALDDAYAAEDRVTVVRANTAFHIALAAASGSAWLERLVTQIHDGEECDGVALLPTARSETTFRVEAHGHREILEALRAADANGVEQALRRHLSSSKEIFTTVAMPSTVGLDNDPAAPFDLHPNSSASK